MKSNNVGRYTGGSAASVAAEGSMTAWRCLRLWILYLIPVIGWLCLLIHVFKGNKPERRSFARFVLLRLIVIAAVLLVVRLIDSTIFDRCVEKLQSTLDYYYLDSIEDWFVDKYNYLFLGK